MEEAFYPSDEYDSTADERARQTVHPDKVRDLLVTTRLTVAEKRALLASWASDARAVENVPSLRRMDDGSVIEIDALLTALKELDGAERTLARLGDRKRRNGPAEKLVRLWLSRHRDDDDDDPPTAPAALPPPRPAPLVDVAALQPAA